MEPAKFAVSSYRDDMLASRKWHAKAGRTQILGQTVRIGDSNARKIIQAWTGGQRSQTHSGPLKISVATRGKTALDAKLTSVVTSAESAEVPFRELRGRLKELDFCKSLR